MKNLTTTTQATTTQATQATHPLAQAIGTLETYRAKWGGNPPTKAALSSAVLPSFFLRGCLWDLIKPLQAIGKEGMKNGTPSKTFLDAALYATKTGGFLRLQRVMRGEEGHLPHQTGKAFLALWMGALTKVYTATTPEDFTQAFTQATKVLEKGLSLDLTTTQAPTTTQAKAPTTTQAKAPRKAQAKA